MNIEKVLVVDDSKVAHLTLRKMLTERGIGVDWVGSGEDSIAYLQQQKPDVIFMDVMMPGMDGFETAHAITNNSAIGSLPIIMCSANATDEDKQNAEKSGAIDFLSKPYTPAELDSILEKVRASSPTAASPVEESALESLRKPVQDSLELPTEMATAEDEDSLDLSEFLPGDDFSNDLEKPLLDDDEPSFRLPESDTDDFNALPQASISESEIIQRAENAARAAAEKAVRDASASMSQDINQRASAIEEAVVRKATQAAAQAAKSSTQAIAKEIVRSISEQLTRKVNDLITQRLAAQKESGPDLDQMRIELIQAMEKNIAVQVKAAVSGADTQQRFLQLVQEQVLPSVEETARNAAHEIADNFTQQMAETDRSPAALSRANVALFIGLLALICAGGVGLVALGFLP